MPKLAWRLFKGLLSLPLLGLLGFGLHQGLTRSHDGYVVAALSALALLALWAELLGAHRIERWLPRLGLPCGLALIAGSVHLGAAPASGSSCKALCGLSLLLSMAGGPLLAALPWALLGAITVYFSARALLKR